MVKPKTIQVGECAFYMGRNDNLRELTLEGFTDEVTFQVDRK